jgi:hypothetical protein
MVFRPEFHTQDLAGGRDDTGTVTAWLVCKANGTLMRGSPIAWALARLGRRTGTMKNRTR